MTLHVDCSLTGSWFARVKYTRTRGYQHGFNGTCRPISHVRVT